MFFHENSVVVLLVCVTPSWLKSPVKIDSFLADPEPTYVSVVSKSTGIDSLKKKSTYNDWKIFLFQTKLFIFDIKVFKYKW